jgi:ribose/xylose/arabinose/galactoside ABC-type transport system permease subunit
MAAIAKAFSHAFPANSNEIETLKQIAVFCGAGVLVSVLMMTYGLDLSAGFF